MNLTLYISLLRKLTQKSVAHLEAVVLDFLVCSIYLPKYVTCIAMKMLVIYFPPRYDLTCIRYQYILVIRYTEQTLCWIIAST